MDEAQKLHTLWKEQAPSISYALNGCLYEEVL